MIPDWLWEWDKHLSEIALDVAISAVLAAGVTETLRFVYEAL